MRELTQIESQYVSGGNDEIIFMTAIAGCMMLAIFEFYFIPANGVLAFMGGIIGLIVGVGIS